MCLSEAVLEKYLPQLTHSTSFIYYAFLKHLNSSLNLTVYPSFLICDGGYFTIFFIVGSATTSSLYLKFISVELFFLWYDLLSSCTCTTYLHFFICRSISSLVLQLRNFLSWQLKTDSLVDYYNLGWMRLCVFLGERSMGC